MKIRKSKILCKGGIDNEAIRFLEEYSPNSLQELNIIDLESIAEFKLNLKTLPIVVNLFESSITIY